MPERNQTAERPGAKSLIRPDKNGTGLDFVDDASNAARGAPADRIKTREELEQSPDLSNPSAQGERKLNKKRKANVQVDLKMSPQTSAGQPQIVRISSRTNTWKNINTQTAATGLKRVVST